MKNVVTALLIVCVMMTGQCQQFSLSAGAVKTTIKVDDDNLYLSFYDSRGNADNYTLKVCDILQVRCLSAYLDQTKNYREYWRLQIALNFGENTTVFKENVNVGMRSDHELRTVSRDVDESSIAFPNVFSDDFAEDGRQLPRNFKKSAMVVLTAKYADVPTLENFRKVIIDKVKQCNPEKFVYQECLTYDSNNESNYGNYKFFYGIGQQSKVSGPMQANQQMKQEKDQLVKAINSKILRTSQQKKASPCEGKSDRGSFFPQLPLRPRPELFSSEMCQYSANQSMPWSTWVLLTEEGNERIVFQWSDVKTCDPSMVGQSIDSFFDYGFVRLRNEGGCTVSGEFKIGTFDKSGNKIENSFSIYIKPGEIQQGLGMWYLGCEFNYFDRDLKWHDPKAN